MSLLAPLYFAGALAVGLPILFHLIRRQPRGQVEFSSLMFLRPTPPRLTRRSRLDNWLLLLLRGLALILLAAAFARPFLRSVAISESEVPGRRIVLLVDTSASMQRADLWQQTLEKAEQVISDLQPADSLALVTFDATPKIALGFDDSGRLNVEQLKSSAGKALRQVKPGWHATDLGRAIRFAGDLAVTQETRTDEPGSDLPEADAAPVSANSSGPAHVILLTDLQAGSEVESLQVYAWPKELRLDVRQVTPSRRTNASAQILAASSEEGDDPDRMRVRVFNAADSEAATFRLKWTSTQEIGGSDSQSELPVQVPPGQTRVLRMPAPGPGIDSLTLAGDEHSFDNVRYVIAPEPVSMSLAYFGQETDDPRRSLLYYLRRVPLNTSLRTVSIETDLPASPEAALDPSRTPVVVLARGLNEQATEQIRAYLESGGRLLVVLPDEASSQAILDTVNAVASSQLKVSEATVDDYVMFSKIDFAHPLFEPMADPQFNDFSKIRFWSHRELSDLDETWKTVVNFDDGDPALVEKTIGKGRLLLLSTGWQPEAGQLALSTKFIPLVYSLFELGRRGQSSDQYVLGEPIDAPPSPTAMISGPSQIEFNYRSSEDATQIDRPGIYTFRDGEEVRSFAVNLAESESRTDPMSEEELERFGIALGTQITTDQAKAAQRQLRDRELESQQKLWQWLLVGALVILGLETLLAGWWSRREANPSYAASSGP
jgi:hypothetical protein